MINKATVISFVNQKGGVGKTTSTIEIAATLKLYQKKKVLIIDFDQQSHSSKFTGADMNCPSIYDVLSDIENVDMQKAIQHLEFFDIITASSGLSKADREFDGQDDVFLLDDFINGFVSDEYDYILIDTNPGRNMLLNMVYVASDYLILITDPDEGGTDGMREVNKDLLRMKNSRMKLSHADILGIIVTKFKKNINGNIEILNDCSQMAAQLDPVPFVKTVRNRQAASDARKYNVPICEYDPKNDAVEDYKLVSKEIVKRTNKKQMIGDNHDQK